MPAAVEIQSWLEDIGLGRYADVFRDNNIGFSRLRLMSRAELSKLGISSDHQRILLSAAARNGTRFRKPLAPSRRSIHWVWTRRQGASSGGS